MTVRRPLVLKDGHPQQLPAGDTLMGVPVFVPAFRRGGAAVRLLLTTTMTLPVITRAGSALQVQVIPNG
ncbi:hypothetical protein [Pseudomonas gingeri]|uniref:hypothetical protein n=1 Tax=Pseudomonas gingeri TaxID=117681 RepID=UPI0015B85103|nr:hypothetical protein [Pseudomonas gingeri]NWD49008.1 hypothetical protein [Pseudomonas gingeri]